MFCSNPCGLGTSGDVQQSYVATLESEWEVSMTFLIDSFLDNQNWQDTYSQVPLQCDKLEAVKTPETIC